MNVSRLAVENALSAGLAQPARPAAPVVGEAHRAPPSPAKRHARGPARARVPGAPSGGMHGGVTLKLHRAPSAPAAAGQKAPAKFPAIDVQNRTRYSVATCVVLGLFVASLAIAPGLVPRARLFGTSLQCVIGIGATVLLLSNFLVAARRRGQLGLAGRGHYALWVGLHLLSTLGALAVLTVHVSGRHGYGVSFLTAISIALVSAAGLPGALLWRRTTGDSRVLKVIKRNWLRAHVVLLAAFLVGLLAHVFQVIYF